MQALEPQGNFQYGVLLSWGVSWRSQSICGLLLSAGTLLAVTPVCVLCGHNVKLSQNKSSVLLEHATASI